MLKGARDWDVINACRKLFENTHISATDIAPMVDCSKSIISTWSKEFGWERPKNYDPTGLAERVQNAKNLFESTTMTFEKIGVVVGTHGTTVANWKRKYGWKADHRIQKPRHPNVDAFFAQQPAKPKNPPKWPEWARFDTPRGHYFSLDLAAKKRNML